MAGFAVFILLAAPACVDEGGKELSQAGLDANGGTYLITASGTYRLTSDLIGNGNDPVLDIEERPRRIGRDD